MSATTAATTTATSHFALDLPAPSSLAFSRLTLESAGSPAPWQTIPNVPLRPRVLVAALVTLSRALAESREQGAILVDALARARQACDQQRLAAQSAKEGVLQASKAAQDAHAEAKRVEKLNGAFKAGADRTVAALDRRVFRSLRKGKAKEVLGAEASAEPDSPLSPFAFVEELLVDLELDAAEVHKGVADTVLDDEWKAIEDDLVATIAARAIEKASSRLTSEFRLPELPAAGAEPLNERSEGDVSGGDGSNADASPTRGRAMSLPPTPPGSVHSSSSERDDPAEDESDYDSLISLLTPLVHPVLALLFRTHTLLDQRLTSSIDHFESLVRASAKAVDVHRQSVVRLNKLSNKLRDLQFLERREREEEERVMEEMRDTVVELARLRKGIVPDEGEAEEAEE
ncbi:hypothetical protein RTBOTA2_002370 [Rhodotorula toruloides]|uniref:Uncharacterized protein n=2 Tax=Rhodotorula toruloides TaxID=5286 RepID=A0A2S9ZVT6_RHOTO|nr:hypothetical protein RTBOTA2_002370 [Rhodotorula toruloides]PRQ69876.1 hypothetical protein AAT19DRAFT_11897 [Rhodotorula toruloides]